MSELLPLRRNRDFVLFQTGGLLSTFGSGISGIAYPLLTLALTGSAAKTGYVGAVEFTPLVLLSAPAGVAADRFDRRLLMIASDAVGASALGVLGAAVLVHHAAYWLIVVVAFVDTSAAVVYRSGSSGAMKAVVPQPQLADASSVTMARMSIVRLTAPPVGGALFALSRGLPFVADAISYAFSTASMLLMRTPFQEKREPGARTPFREGLVYFWRIPFLRDDRDDRGEQPRSLGRADRAHHPRASTQCLAIRDRRLRRAHRRNAAGRVAPLPGPAAALPHARDPPVGVLDGSRLRDLPRVPERLRARGLRRAARLLVPEHRLGDRGVLVHAHPRPAARPDDGCVEHAARGLGAYWAARRRALLAHASPRICILALAAPVVVAALLGTASSALRDLPSLSASRAGAD